MNPISILLVDKNRPFNDILTCYIADVHYGSVNVIGSAGEYEEAFFLAHHLRPDLILHDLGLPRFTGVPSMRALRQPLPQIGIIALTALDNIRYRSAAIEAEADDVVYKGDLAARLEMAIQRVCKRRIAYYSSRVPILAAPCDMIH